MDPIEQFHIFGLLNLYIFEPNIIIILIGLFSLIFN